MRIAGVSALEIRTVSHEPSEGAQVRSEDSEQVERRDELSKGRPGKRSRR
jgi:hypothetical protein